MNGLAQTTQPQPQRVEGTVKWFSYSRGYGYITTEDCDVFVHRTAAEEPLRKGQKVTLEIDLTERGLRARKVQRVKSVLETRLTEWLSESKPQDGVTHEA
jgi:CspA family cold shock protein